MVAALLFLIPVWALGQESAGVLVGTPRVVNTSPGDQMDPHVSGEWVVYTNQPVRDVSEIRYHHLTTGEDLPLPTGGGLDSLSDIQGTQVVFTRTSPTDATNHIYRFDVRLGGVAEELVPRPGTDRRTATVGGHTVAWQDVAIGPNALSPEIHVYNQDTLALTRLTADASVDRTPAVSEDGRTVVWSKCATSVDGCDIWAARELSAGYHIRQITGSEGEETQPDTNGEVVVYVSRAWVNGVLESDIAWTSLEGGEAQRLSLPGTDTNPSISGPLIAFEHWDATSPTPNYDIHLYDLRTRMTYRLTETPASESLSDISYGANGQVRLVWAMRQNGEYNVYANEFRLPIDCHEAPSTPSAQTVCATPGNRQLQGVLQVTHSVGQSVPVSTPISGHGTGVVCVDNGYGGPAATSGWVWLGEGVAVDPHDFTRVPAGVARKVPLQGSRPLSAEARGQEGSSFRVRLYGSLVCEVAAQDATFQPTEVRQGEHLRSEPLDIRCARTGGSRYFVRLGDEAGVAWR
ncbi:TolB family protein [Cystobacter fuscus]|nr:hypothetical protein [Cystobacter fuscus]